MKQFLLIAWIFLLQTNLLAQNQPSNDNVLIISPLSPTLDDNDVMVTFDAARGNGRLAGIQEAVYLHTGVLTNQSTSPSDWKYIQTQWGSADMRWKMNSIGNNRYTFRIGNIRQFYNLPAGEIVKQLAFVFRNANGTLIGKNANNSDLFINVNNAAPIPSSTAPIVSLNVPMPTLNENNLMITFDANAGNRQLLGTQEVYIHTGVITTQSKSPSDWKYIQTQWGTPNPRSKMNSIGNNRYTFTIGNIKQFYSIPNGETVLQLAVVFRNANGTLIGKNANQSDIFIPINGQNNNNNTVNNRSSSNNVVINNNTVNNSSSSNNVIINNNNSSARSNSTVNNNGNVQQPTNSNNRPQGNPTPPNPSVQKIRLSMLQNTSTNDNVAFILSSGKDMLFLNGTKNADGELTALQNIKWADNTGSAWYSLNLDNNGLPSDMTASDGTNATFSNFNNNGFDADIRYPNGKVEHKTSPNNLLDKAPLFRDLSAFKITGRACTTVALSKIKCDEIATGIKSSLFLLSAVGCMVSVAGLVVNPTPFGLLGVAIGCGSAIASSRELFERVMDCNNMKYAKNKNLPTIQKPLETLGWLTMSNPIDFIQNAFSAVGGYMADNLDKKNAQNNQLPNCKPPLPAGFDLDVYSEFRGTDYGYAKLSNNQSSQLDFRYTKSVHEMDAVIHFYDQSNNLLTTVKKTFPAGQTKATFSLKVTETNAPNCRSYPGMAILATQYFASNNFDYTFIRILVTHNGYKYWVGKDFGYYDNRGGLELNGKGDGKTPFCSYTVSE